MARFISKQSIDEVSEKTDIVRLIGERVQLEQRGRDWWGCCPFHSEKTASFSVSPEKKFYYCFGCHASGTAIDFLKNMDKVSFSEAIEILAQKAGVTLSYTQGGNDSWKEDPNVKLKAEYRQLYTRVATSFHYMLMETPHGKFALDYIMERGLSKETLEKFKIGYSPDDRFWLRRFLEGKNYSKEFLDNSGLFNRSRPETAFFAGRLMFPIFDRNGEVVAMGGRFLRGSEFEAKSKYKNSPETIHYKKGSILYAFNFAKEPIRRQKKAIICEGYMDCIAYHQCGIDYAVAPLGTALTIEQVTLLKPFVDEIILSFDSDNAGQKATQKAILMCRQQNIPVKVIRIEGGKDPAEIMVNFGADYLTNVVKGAIFDCDFLISKLLELYPKDTPEGKSKAMLDYFVYIDSLQSEVQKETCLDLLCQAFEIEKGAARKDFQNRERLTSRLKNVNTEQSKKPEDQTFAKPSAELQAVMTAVTDDSSLFQNMYSQISAEDLEDEASRQLFKAMEECLKENCFSVPLILNRIEGDRLKGFVIKSMELNSENSAQSAVSSLNYLKNRILERRKKQVKARILQLEHSANPQDKVLLQDVLKEAMEIDSKLKQFKD
ncbi:MAG: DNA primase [Treponema sp.]|nr:DNA primase [Treponema sp.]